MDFFYRQHTILVMFLSIFQKREIIAHTYSWHHKNKTLYYIRMYWMIIWQPTVREQQIIFEYFRKWPLPNKLFAKLNFIYDAMVV